MRRFTADEEKEFRKTAYEKYWYGFELTTMKRIFYLFASNKEEREMWITGFEYVIISTNRVQMIMDKNREKMNKSMERTVKQV